MYIINIYIVTVPVFTHRNSLDFSCVAMQILKCEIYATGEAVERSLSVDFHCARDENIRYAVICSRDFPFK